MEALAVKQQIEVDRKFPVSPRLYADHLSAVDGMEKEIYGV